MRLNISHTTRYSYSEPIRRITQSMRLFPTPHAGQTIESWNVEMPEGSEGTQIIDGAGNIVQTHSIENPSDIVEIRVDGVVETSDTNGVLRDHKELIHPLSYLQKTHATRADRAIIEMTNEVISNPEDQITIQKIHDLANRISDALTYETASTSVTTTARQALENGRGVCQDYAHLLISACGVVGVPARYISGYLLASDQLSPDEASHAWAEVYVSDLGWVGFDPANHCCPNENYVRLASGLDANRAAPIRGISRGVSHERLEVEVAVQSMQQ